LLDTFFSYLVDHVPQMWSQDGKLLHIGDDFGGMFAWLWRTDQAEAIDHLERYIRLWRAADHAPTVQSLDDVLVAMQFAADLTDEEYQAICVRAHAELAGKFPDPA
jgi:hypothetical protein